MSNMLIFLLGGIIGTFAGIFIVALFRANRVYKIDDYDGDNYN